jgi:XRE family transcriptional regulator, regulator of sulfur utilization
MPTSEQLKSRKELGRKLLQAREAARLTQVELAKKAGINDNYYARVERAEVSPTLEKFEKIVKALGVKPSKILNF